ncbi:MAG: YbdK family carboxylate-amine ligase [Bradymonadaceae bacterium]
MEFAPSTPESVGLELELQIVDRQTLELVDGIMPLLSRLPDPDHVKPEFTQTTVELVTSPFEAIAPLNRQLRGVLSELRDLGRELDMAFVGAGTHPFSTRYVPITPDPRYRNIEKESGFLSHDKITFATHVHVGVPDPATMMDLFGQFTALLPVLIALSANSPFWHGHRTGFAAFRHRELATSRSYGTPPMLADWGEMQACFGHIQKAGIGESMRDLHWDVRPRPDLGTVEIRTMDAQSTVSEAVGFAALTRALARYVRTTDASAYPELMPRRSPVWLERENHFQATHTALEARYVDSEAEPRALRPVAETVLEVAAETSRQIGERSFLEPVEQLLERPGYRRQIAIHERTDSLEEVVRELVEILPE